MKNKFGSKDVGEIETDDLEKNDRIFSNRKDCGQKKGVKSGETQNVEGVLKCSVTRLGGSALFWAVMDQGCN
jgi:hypothetical protein